MAISWLFVNCGLPGGEKYGSGEDAGEPWDGLVFLNCGVVTESFWFVDFVRPARIREMNARSGRGEKQAKLPDPD